MHDALNSLEKLFKTKYYLPRSRKDMDFIKFLRNLYDEFTVDMKKYNIYGIDINVIHRLCDNLIEVINIYYRGKPAEAYKKFEEVMNYKYDFMYLSDQTTYRFSDQSWLFSLSNFYKIRPGEKINKNDKTEIFHVPFTKRHLVSQYRYSILGYPSLYLGLSQLTCWYECNKPKKFNVAEYKLNDKNMRFLDFSKPPSYFAEHIRSLDDDEYIRKYLITYPLLAACSMIVPDRNVSFKSEYIIPQLLLEWIRSKEIYDGVIYFSCIDNDDIRDQISLYRCNIVIPTCYRDNQQYCSDLIEKFEISDIKYINLFDRPELGEALKWADYLHRESQDLLHSEGNLSMKQVNFLIKCKEIYSLIIKEVNEYNKSNTDNSLECFRLIRSIIEEFRSESYKGELSLSFENEYNFIQLKEVKEKFDDIYNKTTHDLFSNISIISRIHFNNEFENFNTININFT